MTRGRRQVAVLSFALLGCGTSEALHHDDPSPALVAESDAALSQGATLGWLRRELDRLRLSSSDRDAAQDWQQHDVSVLVGVSRDALISALGEPDVCAPGDNRPCAFGPGVVVYAFYRMGARMGGGPNLALRFDGQGTCTGAEWIVTK